MMFNNTYYSSLSLSLGYYIKQKSTTSVDGVSHVCIEPNDKIKESVTSQEAGTSFFPSINLPINLIESFVLSKNTNQLITFANMSCIASRNAGWFSKSSLEELSERTGFSKRTSLRHLKWLLDKECIGIHDKTGKYFVTSKYKLTARMSGRGVYNLVKMPVTPDRKALKAFFIVVTTSKFRKKMDWQRKCKAIPEHKRKKKHCLAVQRSNESGTNNWAGMKLDPASMSLSLGKSITGMSTSAVQRYFKIANQEGFIDRIRQFAPLTIKGPNGRVLVDNKEFLFFAIDKLNAEGTHVHRGMISWNKRKRHYVIEMPSTVEYNFGSYRYKA